MQDLFITTGVGEGVLGALESDYAALIAAHAEVERLYGELKTAKGQLLPESHDDKVLKQERLRRYEVAAIRLIRANGGMHELIEPLKRAYEAVLETYGEKDGDYDWRRSVTVSDTAAIAINNVVCAIDLYNTACSIYFEVADLRRPHCFSFQHSLADRRAAEAENPRDFVVMASGHGSRLRFCGEDPAAVPAGPYMTMAEAERAGNSWCMIADTIGGGAAAYSVSRGEIVKHL